MTKLFNRVLVTGGAGYVGSSLVPKLLGAGYEVTVLDLYIFGRDVFAANRHEPGLREVEGDIRNLADIARALSGCDAVIHLACISNDPSFDLDPALGRSINFDCFPQLVQASKAAGVRRFIYASSSSVYGIKNEPEVTEDLPLQPLTDYSKYKALCEEVLIREREPGFVTVILRPATICGYARHVSGWTLRSISSPTVQLIPAASMYSAVIIRPNLHVEDMTDLYLTLLGHQTQSSTARYGMPDTIISKYARSQKWCRPRSARMSRSR